MRLAITICATERYAYALPVQARRVASCVQDLPGEGHTLILVGDSSKRLDYCEHVFKELFQSPQWIVERIKTKKIEDKHANYKSNAQLTIAQLRTLAFTRARALKVDLCWSLDSDVLPPPNALKCMMHMLEFDDGYYSISTCPYPSQGGGGYLGGRGTAHNHILQNYFEDEVKMPEEMKEELDANRAKLKELAEAKASEKEFDDVRKKLGELDGKIRELPPKGNVFEMNAKQWRRRGWFDNAYPAIGKGAILPSDWCGFGCTLMNKRALNFAHFDGYSGGGTEDLYIVWARWYPQGLRINVIPHCPCDHVIRNPGNPEHYVLQHAHHETEGECVGHMRIASRPFYSHEEGELFNEKNDGVLKMPQKAEGACPAEALAKADVDT